ncbi:MAG: hypothetical protein JXN61_01930 [Sedimentisphaerales bacterium]|nr:hypothetical protein [Sedimentisphaerales bacterium]
MQIGDKHIGRVDWNINARDLLDPSVFSLLASNAALIIWAVVQRWPLPFVVCVYWAQSVIIGIFWFFTILTYGRVYKLSADGYEERSALERTDIALAAIIFALHYGGLHAAYLFGMLKPLILAMMERISEGGDVEINIVHVPVWALLIFTGIFFVERLFTFIRERNEYAQKDANLAKLNLFPYARIIPMHVSILLGASFVRGGTTSQSGLVLFLLLKTAADVFMHIVQKKGFSDVEGGRIDDSGPRILRIAGGPVLLMPSGERISLADKPQIEQKLRGIARFPKDIRLKVCQSLLGIKDTPQEQPAVEEIACRCRNTDFIDAESAAKYADGHLNWLETAEDGLISRYICPQTRKTWVMVAGALKAEQPKSDETLCRCAQIDHLDGPQAQRYAKDHLKAVETDGGWQTTYICPYTEKRWLLDYTKMADHDQAQYARLRPLPPKTEQH